MCDEIENRVKDLMDYLIFKLKSENLPVIKLPRLVETVDFLEFFLGICKFNRLRPLNDGLRYSRIL